MACFVSQKRNRSVLVFLGHKNSNMINFRLDFVLIYRKLNFFLPQR